MTGINPYGCLIIMIINVSSHHIGSSSCDIFNDSPDNDDIQQLKAKLRKLEGMLKDAEVRVYEVMYVIAGFLVNLWYVISKLEFL